MACPKASRRRASILARPRMSPAIWRAAPPMPKSRQVRSADTPQQKPRGAKGTIMANIPAGMVKDLRDKTGAGMMDCKTALTETNADFELAVDWLRKKGLAKAAKKAGRT